jgi:hypothetical protein
MEVESKLYCQICNYGSKSIEDFTQFEEYFDSGKKMVYICKDRTACNNRWLKSEENAIENLDKYIAKSKTDNERRAWEFTKRQKLADIRNNTAKVIPPCYFQRPSTEFMLNFIRELSGSDTSQMTEEQALSWIVSWLRYPIY